MGVWQREIKILILCVLIISIIGAATGYFLSLFSLLTFAMLVRQIIHINRFENWIITGGKGPYPEAKGIWEEIYYNVYRIKKNERRRKKKLRKIIKMIFVFNKELKNVKKE